MRLRPCLSLVLIGLVTQVGCVGGSPTTAANTRTVAAQPAEPTKQVVQKQSAIVEASHQDTEFPDADSLGQDALTPGVLMPRKAAEDAIVARIGGFPIRKSHIYDRLFEVDTLSTKRVVDTIAFDILLAGQARQHKIFIDPATIDTPVQEEVDRMVAEVQRQWRRGG